MLNNNFKVSPQTMASFSKYSDTTLKVAKAFMIIMSIPIGLLGLIFLLGGSPCIGIFIIVICLFFALPIPIRYTKILKQRQSKEWQQYVQATQLPYIPNKQDFFGSNSSLDFTVTSKSQLSDISKKYEYIRKRDALKNVSYDKQSKLVSIFTRKWYDVCLNDFVVLDFETTGLDKVYDNIIEIAAIRYVGGVEKEKYVTLVKPDIGIHNEATNINHITNKMLRSAPPQKEAIPKLISFLGNSLIVGHNVNFDIGFLEIAAQRLGIAVKYNYIDTMSISKKLFHTLTDYKLGTIAKTIGIDTSKLHRAEADVYVCAEIVKIAIDTLSGDFSETAKMLKAVKTSNID